MKDWFLVYPLTGVIYYLFWFLTLEDTQKLFDYFDIDSHLFSSN